MLFCGKLLLSLLQLYQVFRLMPGLAFLFLFLMSDQPNISVGNTINTSDCLETFKIIQISYDRYNGKPELLKAYY